ncbi:MAG: hypothetical protein J3K34DRAFT_112458 [Monoraphidium minutum]|nr:MAG: hypothetical protein J3K34DRAFT_112458 [Monoraphidium minutum]
MMQQQRAHSSRARRLPLALICARACSCDARARARRPAAGRAPAGRSTAAAGGGVGSAAPLFAARGEGCGSQADGRAPCCAPSPPFCLEAPAGSFGHPAITLPLFPAPPPHSRLLWETRPLPGLSCSGLRGRPSGGFAGRSRRRARRMHSSAALLLPFRSLYTPPQTSLLPLYHGLARALVQVHRTGHC